VEELKVATYNPWDYYLPEYIQLEANHFSVRRILEFLESAPVGMNPRSLTIVEPIPDDEVSFKLFGWCPDPERLDEVIGCSFVVTLRAAELADDEKKRVMACVRSHYASRIAPDNTLKRKVFQVLRIKL
jgi:hypothetical protein